MVQVRDIAHGRSGDKGDISNVNVIAYTDEGWAVIRDQLTTERVMETFKTVAKGPVERYEVPGMRALNFVIHNALGGGVTRSLAQDAHGKCYSSLMMTIELPGHNR